MRRRTRLVILAAAAGLILPVAVDNPAGALDQDLVVSATAGPPGTQVTASSASCADGSAEESYFTVSFYTGTAPNQQIAAYAQGDSGEATFTIPDWVDPDQPAVIKASCEIYTENDSDDITYDPVDFDVEAGVEPPVQVRTFSRTELLAGQGFTIEGNCGAGNANGIVEAVIGDGTDQTGQSFENIAGQGFGEAGADGSFSLDVYVTNAYVSLDFAIDGDTISDVTAVEEPMNIPAGDYTAFVYCSADDGDSLQFLEPQPMVVTGDAPTNGIDLTNTANTRNITLAGSCAAGDVTGAFETYDTEDLTAGFDAPAPDAPAARTSRFAAARADAHGSSLVARRTADANLVRSNGTNRALSNEGYSEFGVAPGADGTWQASDTVGFDQGLAIAVAFCGDPMADGYVYDPQGTNIDVTPVPPTVPTTQPQPAPAPANAVQGQPTYAG